MKSQQVVIFQHPSQNSLLNSYISLRFAFILVLMFEVHYKLVLVLVLVLFRFVLLCLIIRLGLNLLWLGFLIGIGFYLNGVLLFSRLGLCLLRPVTRIVVDLFGG